MTHILRKRLLLWLPPLLLVLVSGALLSAYRVVYSGRVAQLEAQLADEEGRLASLQMEHERVADLAKSAQAGREGIELLYQDHFSTEKLRLTAVIREVKELARRAGLDPLSYKYPEQELEDYDLVSSSIVFSTVGTYENLRTFINMLELSDSFLSLDDVQVGSNEPPRLRFSLTISTLFADPRAIDARQQTAQGSNGEEEA